MKFLSKGLIENKSITTLILQANFFEENPKNINILSLTLKENSFITTLDLIENEIDDNVKNRLRQIRNNLQIIFN